MKRREFIALLGGAAAWPLVARAQQPGQMRRIGFLVAALPPAQFGLGPLAGLAEGLRELGYVEHKDFVIVWRSAEGRYEQLPDIAAELVRLRVDVIVASASVVVRAAQRATDTIPIVMGYSIDPVRNGFVASFARPGGNITGLAGSSDDSSPKQLELLAAVVPNLSRVGLLINPDGPGSSSVLKRAQDAAQQAGLTVLPVEARNPQDFESAFLDLTRERVGAVLVAGDSVFFTQRKQVVELALRHRLALIAPQREYAEAGGMMSYGESLKEFYRRAASFVDKIFKGAKPADLPIEQPTRFHLVINRKTADMIGLTIPPNLYIFADEVIE
jgi:putative ABC transport system substrate-binding protein